MNAVKESNVDFVKNKKIAEIVEEIFEFKIVPFHVKQHLNNLLWSQKVDSEDLKALQRLIDGLSSGLIECEESKKC